MAAATADEAAPDGTLGASGYALVRATAAEGEAAAAAAAPGRREPLFATLGEGGFGVVFAATRLADGAPLALKRIRKDAHASSALRELRVGHLLADLPPTAALPGLASLCRLEGSFASARHVWLAYPRAGASLAALCYRWKGVTAGGERLYDVTPLPFHAALASRGPAALGALARELLRALGCLHALGVAHNDVKPDNILLTPEPGAPAGFGGLRLVDFGSATLGAAALAALPAEAAGADACVAAGGGGGGGGGGSGGFNCLHAAPSPEFAPPELLARSAGIGPALGARPAHGPRRGGAPATDAYAAAAEAARAAADAGGGGFGCGDVWAAGAVLLEVCAGVPLWFSYKMRALRPRDGRLVVTRGLFGASAREPLRIVTHQLRLVGAGGCAPAGSGAARDDGGGGLEAALFALPSLPAVGLGWGGAPLRAADGGDDDGALRLLARCLRFDPRERPGAARLADHLDAQLARAARGEPVEAWVDAPRPPPPPVACAARRPASGGGKSAVGYLRAQGGGAAAPPPPPPPPGSAVERARRGGALPLVAPPVRHALAPRRASSIAPPPIRA